MIEGDIVEVDIRTERALLFYSLFLITVSDAQGLSYYSDPRYQRTEIHISRSGAAQKKLKKALDMN